MQEIPPSQNISWTRKQYNKAKKALKKFLDEFVKEYSEEGDHAESVSLPLLPNPTIASVSGIPGIVLKGLQIFLLPAIKAYQAWNFYVNKDPNAKKPTLTRREAFYFFIDITLFALAIAAVALLQTVAGAIIGMVAAFASLVASAFQYGNYLYQTAKLKKQIEELDHKLSTENLEPDEEERLTEELNTLRENYTKLEQDTFAVIKRTLNMTFTGLYVASAGLILGGILLGPVGVGLPAIVAGVALATTVSVISVAIYVVDLIKKHYEKKIAENPQKYVGTRLYKLLRGGPGSDNDYDLNHDEGIEMKDFKKNSRSPSPSLSPSPSPSFSRKSDSDSSDSENAENDPLLPNSNNSNHSGPKHR